MTDIELVEKYAEAWRKLDVSIIEPFLDESFTYSSFYVFESLNKERYIEYLAGKFNTLKSNGTAPEVSTGVERTGKPCVILKQGGNDPACITVQFKNGKISEGYMIPASMVC